MKNLFRVISMSIFVLFFSPAEMSAVGTTSAVIDVEATEMTSAIAANQKGKIGTFFSNKKQQIKAYIKASKAKYAAAKEIDLQDDVEKWKWYWLLGWGAGLVLTIVGSVIASSAAVTATTTGVAAGFGIGSLIVLLGSLVATFGTVALIIWLVKKLG